MYCCAKEQNEVIVDQTNFCHSTDPSASLNPLTATVAPLQTSVVHTFQTTSVTSVVQSAHRSSSGITQVASAVCVQHCFCPFLIKLFF